MNYAKILQIVQHEKEETVFDRLKEFCLYARTDLHKPYEITKEDVLNHFCTGFHWKLVADGLRKDRENIRHVPSWFLSHMFVPVRLTEKGGNVSATYSFGGRSIIFKRVFVSRDIKIYAKQYYCIHLGVITTTLTQKQYQMVSKQLEEIRGSKEFRKKVKSVDFSDFQRLGNHYNMNKERYARHFGE